MDLFQFVKNNEGYLPTQRIDWLRGGDQFFNTLMEQIQKSSSTIHFQVYLLESDFTGKLVIEELIKAVKRGVEVNLVVDDFGSSKLDKEDENKLLQSGVFVKRFEPYASIGVYYFGRRMHHKVFVFDERIAIVAGMNVADRYRGTTDKAAWLDYGILVEGPICVQLAELCTEVLERKFVPGKLKLPSKWTKEHGPDPEGIWTRMRRNDFLRNRRDITRSYNQAVRAAKKEITIVGGYFLPGRRFISLIRRAAGRGVEVRIIMTKFSDVPIVKRASEYLYGRLLRAGVRIYECNNTMVHGKAAVIDRQWATIGSYNQNQLSAYISIELNIDVVSSKFCSNFNGHLIEVINKECTPVTNDSFIRSSSWQDQLARWVSYRLVRISLRMLFAMNRIFGVND
ncbi:MAG: phospholipase D-like domain-containing protein [Bacteroidota bacterium]